MNIKWLSNHWFLLCFVFASGGAAAWQEVQRQTLSSVVTEQHQIIKDQRKTADAIAVIKTKQESAIKHQDDIKKKLDLLIELQLKRVE